MTSPAPSRSRTQEIFERVIEQPDADRRDLLDSLCQGDHATRDRVLRLLDALGDATGFLDDDAPSSVLLGEAWSAPGAGEQPGERIGPYQLTRQLGEGGFGRVIEASQEQPLRRRVAIKILKPGMDTAQVIARFQTERQSLALMEHPSIARMLDAGQTPAGRPYFVMELVEGPRITDYCDRQQLTLTQRVRLMRDVCLAVHHAHQKGVIHRDLKPSNVLVSTVDGQPVPKVIDFGIARALDQSEHEQTQLTCPQHMIGTPEYMSPEQARLDRSAIDVRSDVYGLGVLLYELLTGATPFDRATLRSGGLSKLEKIISEVDPPRPSTRVSSTPDTQQLARDRHTSSHRLRDHLKGELDAIIMKCLAKDPDQRYPSADALGEDLGRYLAHEPVLATSPSAAYRVRVFVRRHRASVGFAAAILALIVLGLIGTSVGLLRARELNARLSDANTTLETRNTQLDQAMEDLRAQTQRAIEAQEKTALERDAAQAVTGFFTQDLLLSAIPDNRRAGGASGRDVLLIDVLDAAAEGIEKAGDETGRFHGQPRVEAEVRLALSKTYRMLGQLEQTTRHATRAVELLTTVSGENEERTLAAMHELGIVRMAWDQHDQAESWLRKAFEGRRELLGVDDAQTLVSMGSLAQALQGMGRLRESGALLSDMLPRCERTFGAQHFITTTVRNEQASMLYMRGDYEAAAEQFRAVAQSYADSLGPDHFNTLSAKMSLCRPLSGMGRNEEALAIIEGVIDVLGRKFGPDFPQLITARDIRAQALIRLGRHDQARAELRGLLAWYEQRYEPGHTLTLYTRGELGSLLTKMGQLTQAEAMLRETADIIRTMPPTGARVDYIVFRYLGECLLKQGRAGEAADLFLEQLGAMPGHEHLSLIELAMEHERAGEALAQAGRDVEAVSSLWRSLAFYMDADAEDDARRVRSLLKVDP